MNTETSEMVSQFFNLQKIDSTFDYFKIKNKNLQKTRFNLKTFIKLTSNIAQLGHLKILNELRFCLLRCSGSDMLHHQFIIIFLS